jgi:hypothetical protein
MTARATTAPPQWQDQNIEVVIATIATIATMATAVTDNVAGPPRVVTAHYWN